MTESGPLANGASLAVACSHGAPVKSTVGAESAPLPVAVSLETALSLPSVATLVATLSNSDTFVIIFLLDLRDFFPNL